MRTFNKFSIMACVLLLMATFTPNFAIAQTSYPEYEQEWTWTIPAYAPAKININFVSPDNKSVSDVNRLGTTSHYTCSFSTTNVMFETEDYDTYSFTVILRYNNITLQHLTISVWSGVQQVQPIYAYNFYTMLVTIHFTLQVTKEPVYPTAEETAAATISQLQKRFDEWTQNLQNQIKVYESNIFMGQIVNIVSIVFAAIAVIVAITLKRRR